MSGQPKEARGFAMSRPGCSTSTTRSIRPHCNLFTQVDGRIGDYIARAARPPPRGGARLQKDYYRALRHDAGGADGRPRHQSRRLPRLRPRHRPSPVQPHPGARRRDRRAAGPEVHLHQRLACACREGGRAPRRHAPLRRTSSTSSRRVLARSRREATYRPLHRTPRRRPRATPRCSRTSRATSPPAHALGMTTRAGRGRQRVPSMAGERVVDRAYARISITGRRLAAFLAEIGPR